VLGKGIGEVISRRGSEIGVDVVGSGYGSSSSSLDRCERTCHLGRGGRLSVCTACTLWHGPRAQGGTGRWRAVWLDGAWRARDENVDESIGTSNVVAPRLLHESTT
jgi:hypothetical protein